MPAKASKNFMSALFDAAEHAPLVEDGFFLTLRAFDGFLEKYHLRFPLFVQL